MDERQFEISYSIDPWGITRAFFKIDGLTRYSAYELEAVKKFAEGYTGNQHTPIIKTEPNMKGQPHGG